jgi:transposase
MAHAADRSGPPAAVRTDLGAIFVSLELSRSTWLVTSLSPGAGERMSKHTVRGGDVAGLLVRFAELRAKTQARTGRLFPLVVIQEAGLDGFWIHRVLEGEGIESHVVDAASIATSRRRRRAKTDRIDGEALVRTLLAFKRGEPRVCAMVRAPSAQQEDRRRICRERGTLVAERVEHANRIKGLLFAQGIFGYEPLRCDRRRRLEELTTGDGRPLPVHLRAQIRRELDRLELLLAQLRAWRRSGMPFSSPRVMRPRHPWRRWRGCGGSAPSSPPCSGWSASSAPSATGGRWPPTPGWRRRHGRADRCGTSRACPSRATRGCGPP